MFLLEPPLGHMFLNALVKYQATVYLVVIDPPSDELRWPYFGDLVTYTVLQFSVVC